MSSNSDPNAAPNTYKTIEDWPRYPQGFQPKQNGLTVHPVKNKAVLRHLRNILPGDWSKVYKDGWVNGKKESIHFNRHESGRVAFPKLKGFWSSN